ncbi:helix-turn-helix transcriptional regulator [Kitasatospora aureofaciens]|uniref:helix-turn-helix transcriptional regulator n=1 Tax=Kitasatospora aureofaciens TaxID=1894 RepID=UPI0033DD3966
MPVPWPPRHSERGGRVEGTGSEKESQARPWWNVGNAVHASRRSLRMSQAELAESAGISRRTVNNYEMGRVAGRGFPRVWFAWWRTWAGRRVDSKSCWACRLRNARPRTTTGL